MFGLAGQGGPYSPEGAALGGYGLDAQAHLGLRTAGTVARGETQITITEKDSAKHTTLE